MPRTECPARRGPAAPLPAALAAAALLAACSQPAPNRPASAPGTPAAVVAQPAPAAARPGSAVGRLSLVAETSSLSPGSRVWLAARIELAPGWHVYWENPGESGLKTRARFSVPEGYSIDGPHYPGPEAFASPGGIVSYGYAGVAMLLGELTVPASAAAAGQASVSVEASWLACKDVCIPERGQASLSLPLVATAVSASGPDTAAVTAARGRLPRPWSEIGRARAVWSDPGDRPTLAIRIEDFRPASQASLAYFPAAGLPLALERQESGADGGGARLDATFHRLGASAGPLPDSPGVLRVEDATGPRWFAIAATVEPGPAANSGGT